MTAIMPLTPEALGTAGENLFRTLCVNAGLVCNKSERDLYGWDFRVEMPFSESDPSTLDQRVPRVCQVQVKATGGESGTRVNAKLSAVERLAKDVAPTAVFIFKMRRDGTPLAGYVVHLIDRDLARVLHRLRKATVEGRQDLHHMTMSFDYAKARRFPLTPAGMLAALNEICGEDVAAYTERKQDQLAHLGYEDGGLEADAMVWIDSPDHLARILSGLTPLKPLKLTAYDRRFGIRLPYEGTLLNGVEEISLQPPPAGPCAITIRKGPRDPAALFRCDAYTPPPVGNAPLLIIRHPVLVVAFREDGLEVESVDFSSGRHSLDNWRLILRALTYIDSGSSTISMEFGGVGLPPLPLPGGSLSGPNIEDLPKLLNVVDQWHEALTLAGVAAIEPFSLSDIWAAQTVQMALDILFNAVPLARLEFDVISGAEDDQDLEALYFNADTFAGATVAYAVKVSLTRTAADGPAFTSHRFELLDIRPGVSDLKAYGAEMAANAHLSILIDPANLTIVTA